MSPSMYEPQPHHSVPSQRATLRGNPAYLVKLSGYIQISVVHHHAENRLAQRVWVYPSPYGQPLASVPSRNVALPGMIVLSKIPPKYKSPWYFTMVFTPPIFETSVMPPSTSVHSVPVQRIILFIRSPLYTLPLPETYISP
jgi:hypothetical protein